MNNARENQQKLDKFIADEFKSNAKPLKEMVKKGQLEHLSLPKGELKELKKLLNRYGVNFSVMKDKESEEYSVFFKQKIQKLWKKHLRKLLKMQRKNTIKKNQH